MSDILAYCVWKGTTDRDEMLAWYEEKNPGIEHKSLENARRRFDQLVEIGFLNEVDLTGTVRTVSVSLVGHRAHTNLQTIGKSKP